MAGCPWGGYAVIMLEGAAELRCGAIRDRRIEWGRVQAQQPVHEGTNLPDTALKKTKKKETHSR